MGNLPFQKIKKKKKNKKETWSFIQVFIFLKVILLKTIRIVLIFHTLP